MEKEISKTKNWNKHRKKVLTVEKFTNNRKKEMYIVSVKTLKDVYKFPSLTEDEFRELVSSLSVYEITG